MLCQHRPPTTTSIWEFSKSIFFNVPVAFIQAPARHTAPPPTTGIGKNPPRKPPGAILRLCPRVKQGAARAEGPGPRGCEAAQEAEMATGRSGKLTVSRPFASVLTYLAFYRRLCFIARRDPGWSRGSPRSITAIPETTVTHEASHHLIYLYRPRHLDIITFSLCF